MDDWVARVLGVPVGAQGVAAAVAPDTIGALAQSTAQLAEVPRPQGPPKAVVTNGILAAGAKAPPPDDLADMPDHIAKFAPAFLTAVERELSVDGAALQPGAPLPDQDRMMGLADLLSAALRSQDAWAAHIADAQQLNAELDEMEQTAAPRDPKAYATALRSYESARAQGLAAQQRTEALAAELRTQYVALQRTQPAAPQPA